MVILGATGSIGKNALELCERFGVRVLGLSCNQNVACLNEQIARFKPLFVCVGSRELASEVKGCERVFVGQEGLQELLKASFEAGARQVVNALVGFSGFLPSVCTLKNGAQLCLANKESLVVGGKFLSKLCKSGGEISPIDSEHFGLKFLLHGREKDVEKLVITASGGAFYGRSREELNAVTPSLALKHPTWQMGAKITIDSATLANKLFECIEAFWLFGCKNIAAVVERTSLIHALIQFKDGSTTAHFCEADMKLAIAHATGLYGEQNGFEKILPNLDLLSLKPLEFRPIDTQAFAIFSLKDALLQKPDLGVVINAANEVGVGSFLRGECGFLQIEGVVFAALDAFGEVSLNEVEEVVECDLKVREFAKNFLKGR